MMLEMVVMLMVLMMVVVVKKKMMMAVLMVVMKKKMMGMVVPEDETRWRKNTVKAGVLQLRSAEQEFGTAVRDWQGIGRKSSFALFCSKIPSMDSSLPIHPAT